VVGHLADRLAGEDLGMCLGLLDRLGVIRPARRQRHEAVLLEQRRPAIPATRQQPQTVDEHHRSTPGGVGLLALLELMFGDRHAGWITRPGTGHGGASRLGDVHLDGSLGFRA
jgi:hypothetical protein